MKTPEEGYAKGWSDAIYAYESKQRKRIMTQERKPLPDSFYAALGDNSDCHAALIAEVRAYGEACAAAEREAAARICEKYFHSTCARVIRKRGEA